MTLPYPDSPDIDENIATSIERIKDNLDYLDGLIGSGNVKAVFSSNVELSTKSGIEILSGVGFQPKAMLVFATYNNLHMNSWGCATEGTNSLSIDCGCVAQNEVYGGIASSLEFMRLYQTSGVYVAGSVSYFTSTGVKISWDNSTGPAGAFGNILYFFFG